MASQAEELTRKWFDAIWNRNQLDLAEKLMASHCVLHDVTARPGALRSFAEFRAQAEALRDAFPDIHLEIDDLVSDGERVVVRCTVTGTHRGHGLGIPPSNRRICVTGMAWGRWKEGKLTEAWDNFDLLSMYEQIGYLKRPSGQ